VDNAVDKSVDSLCAAAEQPKPASDSAECTSQVRPIAVANCLFHQRRAHHARTNPATRATTAKLR
jgi:hypothetical protein